MEFGRQRRECYVLCIRPNKNRPESRKWNERVVNSIFGGFAGDLCKQIEIIIFPKVQSLKFPQHSLEWGEEKSIFKVSTPAPNAFVDILPASEGLAKNCTHLTCKMPSHSFQTARFSGLLLMREFLAQKKHSKF